MTNIGRAPALFIKSRACHLINKSYTLFFDIASSLNITASY
jgi:hypothetical protein